MEKAGAAVNSQSCKSRNAECRKVGLTEYRQADQFLRAAAATGSLDAQERLLRRRGEPLLNGALRECGARQASEFGPIDEREARTINSELERLALHGHQASMATLDQLLPSPLPALADPAKAAAWRLVSYQAPGHPSPTAENLAGSVEVLHNMDDTTRQRVLAVSRSLFERCCAQ